MSTFKTLLIASAVGVIGFAATDAGAVTYVTNSSHVTSVNGQPVVTTAPAVRVVAGRTVAADSRVAVGTRKVGMVGGRPYPIEKARMETTSVNATRHGLVEHTEVTTAGSGIIDPNNGGNYYTETDGSFYADPAWNVNVYSSGGYND